MILEAEDVNEVDAHTIKEHKAKKEHKTKDDHKIKEEHKVNQEHKQLELKTAHDSNKDIKPIEHELVLEPFEIKNLENHNEEKFEVKNIIEDIAEFNENDIAELNEPPKSEISHKVKIISNNWTHLSKYRILTKIFDKQRIIKTRSN
jgi:hypothetical protein